MRRPTAQQATVRVYACCVVSHVGATWAAWRPERQAALDLDGTLAALADGVLLLDVGDGERRSLADVVAEHFDARRDALGDRFVGRVHLRLDLLATPVAPPGWLDGDEPDA